MLDAVLCATRTGTSSIKKLCIAYFVGTIRRTFVCKMRGTSPGSHHYEARMDKRVGRSICTDTGRFQEILGQGGSDDNAES